MDGPESFDDVGFGEGHSSFCTVEGAAALPSEAGHAEGQTGYPPTLFRVPPTAAVAQLNETDFASAVSAITSAFGDPTRRAIYVLVHQRPAGVTAGEVAAHFDLHANVARHHLDKLAAGGYLEIATDRSSGAGRPSKRYRAVAERTPFEVPARHDDVIVTLLGRALAELGTERAAHLAEAVGVEYGQAMAEAMGDPQTGRRSIRAALTAVADALSAHGFSAHTDRDGDRLRIVNDHCPFGDAVIEHPVICAVDRGMVAGMLGALCGETLVDLESSKPMGDARCITSVES
jgi:predicted ArsR family transcriptional regulator